MTRKNGPLGRKQHEHEEQVRALAATIRVERLDEDDADSEEETQRREALSEKLYATHKPATMDAATKMAEKITLYADASHALCQGRGARLVPDGDVAHYVICECAVKEDGKRRAEAVRNAPAYTTTNRPVPDVDKRVAAAREILERALREQTEACADFDVQLAAAREELTTAATNRAPLAENVTLCELGIQNIEREAVLADATLEEAKRVHAARKSTLGQMLVDGTAELEVARRAVAEHDAALAPAQAALAALEQRRGRAHGRFEPKIERARKQLRRLLFTHAGVPAADLDRAVAGAPASSPTDPPRCRVEGCLWPARPGSDMCGRSGEELHDPPPAPPREEAPPPSSEATS